MGKNKRSGAMRILLVLAIFASFLLMGCTNPEAQRLTNLGKEKFAEGDVYGAISYYSQAIEKDPNYAEAYYNRAVARRKTGNSEAAISDLLNAMRLKSDYAEAKAEFDSIISCTDACPSKILSFCTHDLMADILGDCKCPNGYVPFQKDCIRIRSNPKNETFQYIHNGERKNVTFTVYGALDLYLSNLSRRYICANTTCEGRYVDKMPRMVDNPESRELMMEIVDYIKSITSDKEEQARIAITFVQQIPYDTESFEADNITDRYPYEVLYDNMGVCGEKSRLMAFLLKEIGYGVTLYHFDNETHMALGIKCPGQYAFRGTGHCFIETTGPNIPTNDQLNYTNVGKLVSEPELAPISDGLSLDSVYQDVLALEEYNELENTSDKDNWTYHRYLDLRSRYGLDATHCENESLFLCNGICYRPCDQLRRPECTPDAYFCMDTEESCAERDRIFCNEICYAPCDNPGDIFECKTDGATCTSTYNSCPATFCNGICYSECENPLMKFECRNNKAYCVETVASCSAKGGTFCNNICYSNCPSDTIPKCKSSGLVCYS